MEALDKCLSLVFSGDLDYDAGGTSPKLVCVF